MYRFRNAFDRRVFIMRDFNLYDRTDENLYGKIGFDVVPPPNPIVDIDTETIIEIDTAIHFCLGEWTCNKT